MTKKEINKFLADTKVYVNGKSREIQEKLLSFGFLWMGSNRVLHTEKPFLYLSEIQEIKHGDDMKLFKEHEYREITADEILALELTEPTYRPFKDAEECWQEMLKHDPFGWVIVQTLNEYRSITTVGKEQNYALMFDTYTFTDGTPFGIKED